MDQENFKGNERQLKLLLKAIREENISIWNSFAKSSGKYFVANLQGINLSYLNLKEINLKGANLVESNLEGCNLTFANLERTKLMKANLTRTDLTRANITNAYLEDANLEQAIATGANFSNSDLTRTNLNSANLENANIVKTNLKFASLQQTKIKGVKKSKSAKIVLKSNGRELTEDDKKKQSPWKMAKQEETLRRVNRVEKENLDRDSQLKENLRAKNRLNRNVFTNEQEE